ncbi:MAG: nucleoside deaminase [Bacteroidales bacterium]|jgi:tRNA(Arg) A34 adenosine deaminase TadA|nr:nucleoside deaminase [Bacteroidales bacterium]
MVRAESEITHADRKFLAKAVEIAEQNILTGGGPFGALVVRDDIIIASAGNRVTRENDPTAHAEVTVIRMAAHSLGTHSLEGCVLYASCEPCPMCLGAIYWAGISRVVYSATRIDAAAAGFNDDLIYNEITLSPAERKIRFTHIPSAKGRRVFRIWGENPDRIPY